MYVCMCMCARVFSSVNTAGGLYQYEQKVKIRIRGGSL